MIGSHGNWLRWNLLVGTERSAMLMLALLFPSLVFAQSLGVSSSVPLNTPIAVTISSSPGNRLDWVTLTPSVSPDPSYIDWYYLNGSKSQPASGVTSATVTFPAPPPGVYTVRLFANNSLAVKLATSTEITVGNGTTTPASQLIMFNGDSITAPYNITGAQNWTSIVATHLGFPATSVQNIAANDKYASQVLDEVSAMGGQVCMVMIGTNDMVGAVLSSVPAEEHRIGYLSTMREIVIGLKSRCGKVVIVSPPLSLSVREAVRWPAFLEGLRLISVEQGVTFVNVWQHMVDLSAFKSDAEVNSWFSDWRHLTAAGHAVVGGFVAKSLRVQ